jgi:hypothetical protein
MFNCGVFGVFEYRNPAKDLLDDEHVADLICYRLAESTSGRVSEQFPYPYFCRRQKS